MGGFTYLAEYKGKVVRVTQNSSAEVKFWTRVDKFGPIHPVHGHCWQWTGGSILGVHKKFNGRIHGVNARFAHRYSWMFHFGPILNGLWVLHKCDNPFCVNPDHLFLGNHDDNMADMAEKGRSGRAKLTVEQVREIRNRFRFGNGRGRYGSNSGQLGKEYGVTGTAIRAIASRRAYRHVK